VREPNVVPYAEHKVMFRKLSTATAYVRSSDNSAPAVRTKNAGAGGREPKDSVAPGRGLMVVEK